MTVIDQIASRFGYTRRKAGGLPPVLASMAETERFNIPDGSQGERQANVFQKLSWVYLAVSHVAEMAAGTKFSVRHVRGEDQEDIPNHPFEERLRRPNPLQSRFEFLVATFAYLRLTGNAYWWFNRPAKNSPPAEIWVIPTYQIQPIPDGRLFIKGYSYDPNMSTPIFLPPDQVCHFKRFNPTSPFIGQSPIESLMTVVYGDMAMQKWNTNYFGKDNAKVPGALAFADPVPDPDWDQLKADLKEQWGSTSRSGPLLLRNAGKGGVEWVEMSLSQKDMEFLAGRTFNKEEVFATLAPGLASILAVNATEANSLSGKATLMDQAVWPSCVSVAEKITNDVLPMYGEGLIGEFDDPRIPNRDIKLREREAYERVHTVAEIRKEFEGDDPLGDERDELLPVELKAAPAQSFSFGPAQGETPPPEPNGPVETEAPGVGTEGKEDGLENVRTIGAADLVRWRRKVLKAMANDKLPTSVKFVSDLITDAQYERVHVGLKAAATREDVEELFDAELSGRKTNPLEEKLAVLGERLADATRALRDPGPEPQDAQAQKADDPMLVLLREVLETIVNRPIATVTPTPIVVEARPGTVVVENKIELPKRLSGTKKVIRNRDGDVERIDEELEFKP